MASNSTQLLQNTEREKIHVVQHLIEKCLMFYMDRDECVACLQQHGNLEPAITKIVWDELEKSNVEFFASYAARLVELLNITTSSPLIPSSSIYLLEDAQCDKKNQHLPHRNISTSTSLLDGKFSS